MLKTIAFAGAVALGCATGADAAEPPAVAAPAERATLSSVKVDLTPEEEAEREGRRVCKAAICAAFRTPSNGQNVTCAVKKSFRKTQLEKIVAKAKVSWPYGRVVCTTDLKADRAVLAEALGSDKKVVKFAAHTVACSIEHDKKGEAPSNITAELTPEITFEKGKATQAVLNWGKVDGPAIVKGLM
jgi:hypothetical protein